MPEVVRATLEPLGLTAEAPTGTQARERWEALVALAELVDDEVAQRPQLDLQSLLAELRQRADARHPPTVQGVTLASLHAAKGLEFDLVVLVNPDAFGSGLTGAVDPYVAMTRATRELVVLTE